MLVQIIKSEKDSYWYRDSIGLMFDVIEFCDHYILSTEYFNRLIRKEDCKVINPE